MRIIREIINRITYEVSGQKEAEATVKAMRDAKQAGREGKRGAEEFEEGLDKVERRADKVGFAIAGMFGKIKGFARGALSIIPQVLGVGGIGFAGLGALAIKTASDVQEAQSKMRDVLGDGADDLENWAKSNRRSFNATSNDLRMFATDFAVQFKQITNQDRAVDIAKDLTARALDLASFSNKNASDVAADFTSAINGSSETVEKYGINLKDAAVTQFILSNRIRKTKKEITDTDKKMARYRIILNRTSDAAGNASRTSGDFANVLRNLRSEFSELLAGIGERLIPIATRALMSLTDLITANQDKIVDFFGNAAEKIEDFINDGGLDKIVAGLKEIIVFAKDAAKFLGGLVDPLFNTQSEVDLNTQVEANRRAEGKRTFFTAGGLAIASDAELKQAKKDLEDLEAAERRRDQIAARTRQRSFGGISNFVDPASRVAPLFAQTAANNNSRSLTQENNFNISATDPEGVGDEVVGRLGGLNDEFVNNERRTGEGL